MWLSGGVVIKCCRLTMDIAVLIWMSEHQKLWETECAKWMTDV